MTKRMFLKPVLKRVKHNEFLLEKKFVCIAAMDDSEKFIMLYILMIFIVGFTAPCKESMEIYSK